MVDYIHMNVVFILRLFSYKYWIMLFDLWPVLLQVSI